MRAVSIPLDPIRSTEQNDKQWPMLRDIARQVPWWHTDERGHWVFKPMNEASWKAVLTAGFEQETHMALGTDGHTAVMVGASTSKYSKSKFADYIEFVSAFGAAHEVVWSEKSEDFMASVRNTQRAA